MTDNTPCRHNYLQRYGRMGLRKTHPSTDVWLCRDCDKVFKIVEQKGWKQP